MRLSSAAGAAVFVVVAAIAGDASAQLFSIEAPDLRLVYVNPTTSFLIPHVGRCFENSIRVQRRLFGYEPSEDITVLLTDMGDAGNAGASTVPRNRLNIDIAPLSYAYETMVANERVYFVMNHELMHIVANEQAAGADRAWRGLFQGKVAPIAEQPESIAYFYLTTPRAAAPRWYHEGIATFVETWMAGGIGRAQGAYDEMVFRAMVRDGSRFYDPLGLVSEGTKIDFQTESNSYLYGTRFMSWLAWQYSPEALLEWVRRSEGSRAYYSAQFRKVFGKKLEAAWQDWVAFEQDFQRTNLAEIRKFPTTPHTDVSSQALGSVSRAHVDLGRQTIYVALNYPGVVGHVAAISLENGKVERLHDVKQPSMYTVTSLARDPVQGTLFYTTDNYAYRDLVALDPDSKDMRILIKDARVGDLVFSGVDGTLWGIRTFNGVCTLVRIPAPYTEWTSVHSWPYGEVVYDLDVSPDGRLVSLSHGAINGRQSLRVLSIDALQKGEAVPVKEMDFGAAIPSNFVFSLDGRYLFGSSYYTGVSNIFRYEIATGGLEAVSNTETGFFRPVPLGGDSLLVFRFTGEGFVPARIEAKPLEDVNPITFLGQQLVEKYPVLKEWAAGSPASVPFDTMVQRNAPYRSVKGLRLESLYPVLQGYKETTGVGVRINFSDPVGLNSLALTTSYSPGGDLRSSERLHVRADYRRYDWRAGVRYNAGDFYDLFGPTKTSRKGYVVELGHHKTLIYDQPRRLELDVEGRYSGNLDQLPEYQNVAVDVDRLFSVNATLANTDVRSSLGYVDDEKGHKWSLAFRGDYVNSSVFTRMYGTYDVGIALPIGHSSVWVRNAGGLSPQDAAEPFANFYFGGFGNNYVDVRDEKRYRQYYSFPGAELNELGGRNFVRSLVEWNLPPIRFSQVGTPDTYLSWARPALFVGGLATNLDRAGLRREAMTAGGQIDFRFAILSRLDMTLSAGAGVTLEDGQRPRREAMISLKVLR